MAVVQSHLVSKRMRERHAAMLVALRRACFVGAVKCLPVLQHATRNAPPASEGGPRAGGAVDTGRYLKSWTPAAHPEGATIYNSAPYSGQIERGRPRGTIVAPEVLAVWARRRLGVPAKYAFAVGKKIAKAIKKRGQKPRWVMRSVRAQCRKIVQDTVKAAAKAPKV